MATITVAGPTILRGEVRISGSKNAALPILIATILCDGSCKISNVPNLTDIVTTIRLLRSLGLRAEMKNHVVSISQAQEIRHIAPYELITKMRASFLVAGPILAKAGFAKIPYPGGCAIGSRPVDIHLDGFKAFGIEVRVEHGFVIMKAPQPIRGCRYALDFPSVGATESLMMLAVLAEGTTILKNVAREPEIVDLANFLIRCGASISGAGTDQLKIEGVKSLEGVPYKVIPDRIEAATFLLAAALTKGQVRLNDVNPDHLSALITILKKNGLNIKQGDDWVDIVSNGRRSRGINIKTEPYPGFPTDMQPLLMAYATLLKGKKSIIIETIFENRYMHVMELNRMGARIMVEGRKAFIMGVDKLTSANVKMMDLRGGAALLIAALAAEGETVLFDDQHLHRGYEDAIAKFTALGAHIA